MQDIEETAEIENFAKISEDEEFNTKLKKLQTFEKLEEAANIEKMAEDSKFNTTEEDSGYLGDICECRIFSGNIRDIYGKFTGHIIREIHLRFLISIMTKYNVGTACFFLVACVTQLCFPLLVTQLCFPFLVTQRCFDKQCNEISGPDGGDN